jgi:hypothetical protein
MLPSTLPEQYLCKLHRGAALTFLSNSNNLQVFPIDLLWGGLVLANAIQQLARLLFPTNRCEISGTIWKHLDEANKNQCWDTLESK